MLIMVYDTETSGLPDYKQPSEAPQQPHIVELAAILIDDQTFEEKGRVHYIVRPDGWTIPDEVAAIHGITQDRAMDEGIPEWKVIREFHELQLQCGLRVAHNESFDQRIMRICYKRFGKGDDPSYGEFVQVIKDEIAESFKSRPAYCTMKNSTKACALPPTQAMIDKNMGHFFKNPSLQEAHKHYFGEEFEGSHSALADTQACARIYFAITQPQ